QRPPLFPYTTRFRSGRPRHPGRPLHALRDVPVLQRDRLEPAVRDAVPCRRISLATVLAAAVPRRPAAVHQPGAPDPVGPARLPGDLLLLPEGLLPLLLRRSAGLRRG